MIKHTLCQSRVLIPVANTSTGDIQVTTPCHTTLCPSLVPTQCMPSDAKLSGEGSQISWAYSLKLVKTYKIARSLINT